MRYFVLLLCFAASFSVAALPIAAGAYLLRLGQLVRIGGTIYGMYVGSQIIRQIDVGGATIVQKGRLTQQDLDEINRRGRAVGDTTCIYQVLNRRTGEMQTLEHRNHACYSLSRNYTNGGVMPPDEIRVSFGGVQAGENWELLSTQLIKARMPYADPSSPAVQQMIEDKLKASAEPVSAVLEGTTIGLTGDGTIVVNGKPVESVSAGQYGGVLGGDKPMLPPTQGANHQGTQGGNIAQTQKGDTVQTKKDDYKDLIEAINKAIAQPKPETADKDKQAVLVGAGTGVGTKTDGKTDGKSDGKTDGKSDGKTDGSSSDKEGVQENTKTDAKESEKTDEKENKEKEKKEEDAPEFDLSSLLVDTIPRSNVSFAKPDCNASFGSWDTPLGSFKFDFPLLCDLFAKIRPIVITFATVVAIFILGS